MKSALAVASILILSVLGLSIVGQAYALSAATFTSKPTFTSLVSGKWARVWQDSATPTTYFLDVSNTQIKMERINNADGSINSTSTFVLPGSLAAQISAVEKVGGVNRVYYAQIKNATAIYAGIVNIDTGASVSSATFGITSLGAGTSGAVGITSSKNQVYYNIAGDTNQLSYAYSSTRSLTSFASIGTLGVSSGSNTNLQCEVATDGATAASDSVYCVVQKSIGSDARIQKITSSAITSLGTTSGTTGSLLDLVDMSGKMIFRVTDSGGTTYTYSITKSTDTLSSPLYVLSWLSFSKQQFDFDGTTRTYKTGSTVYYATSTHSISYLATSSALTDPAQLYAETVTASSGTISGISSTFYRISDTLIVSGSGTTWTPKVITATTTLHPTTYSEYLLASLVQNSTLISNSGYVRLACDGNYLYPTASQVYAGNSTDCTTWITLANPSATVGRQLPFSASQNLVHADTVTSYTFSLSVANPANYNIETIYGGKAVDNVDFDSSGQAQQRLLYGQCYTMSVTEILSGNSVQSGNVCAGDDTSKSITLTGVTIPSDWLGQTWSHAVTRNFTNPTNNTVLFSVQKSVSPYNASIYVTDNPNTSSAGFTHWYNFTGATGISIANITSGVSINSNQTLWFTVYENGVVVAHDISSGEGFNFGGTFNNLGLLYGLPVALIFPILVALVFPKSMAYFGLIVVGAVIGVMQFFGFLNLGPVVWPVAFGLIALGVVFGVKR